MYDRRAAGSSSPGRKTTSQQAIPFRWTFIILPLAFLLISIIAAAYFYRLIPAETAYHFRDGLPDRWLNRSAIIAWALIPQFLFVLMAAAIIWTAIRLSTLFQQAERPRLKPDKLFLLMGNMIALPQIILSFAILDIFSYNAYQAHIMPLWIFALLVMVVGGIILGVFFILAIRQVWGTTRGRYKELK